MKLGLEPPVAPGQGHLQPFVGDRQRGGEVVASGGPLAASAQVVIDELRQERPGLEATYLALTSAEPEA